MKRPIWLKLLAVSCAVTFPPTVEKNVRLASPVHITEPGSGAPPGGLYVTSFPKAERPISEDKSWINGGAVGLDWANVRTRPGLAFGENLPSRYADPTAVLAGAWDGNQEAEGTVTVGRAFSDCCHEVELRLRTTIRPHAITGYEILCSVVVRNPYLEIVRWNGPISDFTYLGRAKLGCVDGDVLKAIANGNSITVYKNGDKVLQSEDDQFSGGSPGIGFYDTTRPIWTKLGFGTWQDFGFIKFSAMDQSHTQP
jgi:hypothetical protein